MDSIGTALLVLVMAWLLAVWIGGFFRNLPIAVPGQQTLLRYTLSLLIIGVPVGLPVVTTTTLAVGAAYLAKKKAIVQKLTAIESLAVSIMLFPALFPGSPSSPRFDGLCANLMVGCGHPLLR